MPPIVARAGDLRGKEIGSRKERMVHGSWFMVNSKARAVKEGRCAGWRKGNRKNGTRITRITRMDTDLPGENGRAGIPSSLTRAGQGGIVPRNKKETIQFTIYDFGFTISAGRTAAPAESTICERRAQSGEDRTAEEGREGMGV
jgi:hypothetical protein